MKDAPGGAVAPTAVGELPVVRVRELGELHARFELVVPAKLAWFAGHFPGEPVLPGVAQIGWAIRLAREAFGFEADPLQIEQVKFRRSIGPGDSLSLELARHGSRVDWRFERHDTILSRGRFGFMDP